MRLITIPLLLAALAISGCAPPPPPVIVPKSVNLPAWPSYCSPAWVKDPVTGEEMLVIAARERAGRVKANKTILSCRYWYEDVRARYLGFY